MKTSVVEGERRERERRGGKDEDTQVVKRQDGGRAIRRTRNKGNSEIQREDWGGGVRQERGRSNYRRDRQGECFNRAAARRFRPTRTPAAAVAAAAPHSEYQ